MASGNKLTAIRMLAEGTSAIEAHQRMMDRIGGPTNALQKYMATIRAPYVDPFAMSGLRAALDSIYRPSDMLARSFGDLHNSILNPAANLGAALQEAMSPSLRIASVVQEALDPHRMSRGALGAALEANQNYVARLQHPMPRLAELWTDPLASSWKSVGITSRMLEQAMEARDAVRVLKSSNASIDPQGRSFLIDGVAIIEAELGEQTNLEGVRSALERLMAVFLDRVGRATTAFEEERLSIIISLLTFILAAYTAYGSQQNHAELIDSVKGAQIEIAESIDRLRDTLIKQLDEGPRFQPVVVMRNANVRAGPSVKTKAKARLIAEDVVEFIEARDGWFHIRYYDAITDKVESGWVYGRLVRVVPLDLIRDAKEYEAN